jgi:hypothetical protein
VKASLQRLRSEIGSDRRALSGRLDELDGLSLAGPDAPAGDVARAAVALHHAYSAIETILLRVAREVEGEEPTGADWHQGLLERMALDIEGVRPAVLSPTSLADLRALLAFRHFFRHAYAVELDAKQLDMVRSHARRVRVALDGDLDALDAFLARMAAAAGAPPG